MEGVHKQVVSCYLLSLCRIVFGLDPDTVRLESPPLSSLSLGPQPKLLSFLIAHLAGVDYYIDGVA